MLSMKIRSTVFFRKKEGEMQACTKSSKREQAIMKTSKQKCRNHIAKRVNKQGMLKASKSANIQESMQALKEADYKASKKV